jgi:hypothetical protein
MDASLAAELIARRAKPEVAALIGQYLDLAGRLYREFFPAQEFPLREIAKRVFEAVMEGRSEFDDSGLEDARDCLVRMKLLVRYEEMVETSKGQHQQVKWWFRHERVRDYVIAYALQVQLEKARHVVIDPRFVGVGEFLPYVLSKEDADELADFVRAHAADSGNNLVWLRYKEALSRSRRRRKGAAMARSP